MPATRRRIGWSDLTERSAEDQGDTIDVWYDDELWHGVYLGITFGPLDRICHEIMLDDQTSKLIPVGDESHVRRVKPSKPWPLLDVERRLDARDPQPKGWRVTASAALFWLTAVVGYLALFGLQTLFKAWR